ncbi:MAG TPA: ribonuclease P protein component [Thermoanaerobaculia bacterium]|nr:ribonuclease P protein component [Thermoanaerobaculia bacterium]
MSPERGSGNREVLSRDLTGVSERFARDDRLRKRREFEECYASGIRVSGRFLQVFVMPEEGRPRLGISVPKRVGGAAVRNRVRRRLREIFRRNRTILGLVGMRIVVNARPSSGGARFTELREDYASLLRRALSRAKPAASP